MKNNPNIEYKSSASFLYQKFLNIDKRMRRNLVVGVSMVTIVVVTGVTLALISLVQFSGNVIEDALAEEEKETLRSVPRQKIAEKNLLRANKKN